MKELENTIQGGNDGVLTSLIMELRRGTVVLCVLSRLQKPMYGYSLVATLNQGGVEVEANTLYPLLRRLESQELLSSSWDTDSNKPRKYYVITGKGLEMLGKLKIHWHNTVTGVNTLLGEEI